MKIRSTKFTDGDFNPFCSVAAAVIGGAVIGAGASMAAGSKQAGAAKSAAASQAATTQSQLAQQQQMYDQNVQRMQPFTEAGKPALAELQAGTSPGGEFTKGFDGTNFQTDPSYQWRLQQGMNALQGSAAAKGGLMTGQGLADITNYGQGAASQEYGAAFNRYQTQQQQRYNILSGMAQMSQNSAAGVGAQGTQVSQNMAGTAMQGIAAQTGYQTQAANASAAGMMGVGNAVQSGVNNGLSWNYLQSRAGNNPANQYPQTAANANGQMYGPPAPVDYQP